MFKLQHLLLGFMVLILALVVFLPTPLPPRPISPEGKSIPVSKFTAMAIQTPTPMPTPTPKPPTFAELNARYGPCVWLPVLFYHHVEPIAQAKKEGHAQLTVDVSIFQSNMQYLKDRGYNTATMADLINFFDRGVALPPKSVILTFDDGYSDFADFALPILRQFGFRSTLFLPTGLVNNPGYLYWDRIQAIAGQGDVLFANHTWSHHNVASSDQNVIEQEISLAATQLTDHGLNGPLVFAYPYGNFGGADINYLTSHNYLLAFTTRPGQIQCKGQRLTLPRTRAGYPSLSYYGL